MPLWFLDFCFYIRNWTQSVALTRRALCHWTIFLDHVWISSFMTTLRQWMPGSPNLIYSIKGTEFYSSHLISRQGFKIPSRWGTHCQGGFPGIWKIWGQSQTRLSTVRENPNESGRQTDKRQQCSVEKRNSHLCLSSLVGRLMRTYWKASLEDSYKDGHWNREMVV